jgi:predicted DNA-binding ribbon-helix-helix protein
MWGLMNISIVKRSVRIAGHMVDISIEDAFWIGLEEIARVQAATMSNLVAAIDADRAGADLSSAIRVYVLDHFLMQIQNLKSIDGAPNRAGQMPTVRPVTGAPRPRWLN